MTSSMPSFEYESIRLLGFASVSEYQAFDMKSHLMTSAGLRGLYLFRPGCKPANDEKILYVYMCVCVCYSDLSSKRVVFTQQVRIAQVVRTSGAGREEFRLSGQTEVAGRSSRAYVPVAASDVVQLIDHGPYVPMKQDLLVLYVLELETLP